MGEDNLNKLIHEIKSENKFLNDEIDFIKKIIFQENISFEKNYCPFCEEFFVFESFFSRENVQCPKCKSLERDRFSFLLLKQKYNNFLMKDKINVLHFAPDFSFYNFFRRQENIDYYPVDFNPEVYEKRDIKIKNKVNMESIPYEDNKFDLIYNSHVLEHVPDDLKAMHELYRVLKDDGICIVIIPLFDMPKTFEKKEYNTPELRYKYYGQVDHVRKYGWDFEDRLKSVGFKVDKFHPEDIIKFEVERNIYKLSDDIVFICKK